MFLKFAKAFQWVSYRLLSIYFESNCISCRPAELERKFSNREKAVSCCDGYTPSGNKLGMAFLKITFLFHFCSYVNDVPGVVSSKSKIFSDGTKILKSETLTR